MSGPAAGDIARAVFTAAVEDLVRHDALLRLRANEDAVHDARVAVRRLRSDVRTFAPVLDPAWIRALRERMRWLQDAFSAPRDADVLLSALRRQADLLSTDDRRKAEEALAPLREERERAYERMHAMLGDARYAALLQELVDAAKRPPLTARAEEPARDVLPQIVEAAWSKLRKRIRRRSRPPADRELHRIRIAAKRVRYATEAVAAIGGRRAHVLARAVEKLQTVLGDQHDAVIACARLRALPKDGDTAFVAGQLAMLEQQSAAAGRNAWRAAWREAKRAHRAFRRRLC